MQGQVVLRKYRVTRLLDEGGMSKIYLARQIDRDRDVAIKVLKPELLANSKAREHFKREIHIMSRFQHPNTVTCYDSAPNDPAGPLLVMEYLRGADLNLLLHRHRRFTPERTGRLLGQLCDVLHAAHVQGIIHRDIKPGNLMIIHPETPQETLKLMDFGLAKMPSMLYIGADEVWDNSLPPAAGTPEYICPEQVRGNDMDSRGDIYSVGVVLFEMLTGRRPFEYEDVNQLMEAHAEEEPPTFAQRGLTGSIPPGIEAVVRSCLAKYPDDRPADALEVAKQYEKALGKRILSVRHGEAASAPGLAPKPSPSRVVERNAVQHRVEASMPESMALLKIKGFIFDLGGEVVETLPGLIRVRIAESSSNEKKTKSLFGWMDRGRTATAAPAAATYIELHMERCDPNQPSRLTITLVMRSSTGLATPEWRERCGRIGRDLQAYLMGR
jgi:serine/threonine protein kinase